VSVMTTVPVDPVHAEVRLEPDTITLQGVEAAVAEELVELQVIPPLATLVWERLATRMRCRCSGCRPAMRRGRPSRSVLSPPRPRSGRAPSGRIACSCGFP